METMSWNEAKRLPEYIHVKMSDEYVITMYGVKQHKHVVKGYEKLVEWSHLQELNYSGNSSTVPGYTLMQRMVYF